MAELCYTVHTDIRKGDAQMGEYALSYDSGTVSALLRHSRKTLLEQIAFRIGHGESLALIGETGSGKTMTALSILGLLPENVTRSGGEILFDGVTQPEAERMRRLRGNQVVYIPQSGLESLNPAQTVRRQFCDQLRKLHIPRNRWEDTARSRLALAGLEDPAEILQKYPFQLSGGMAQRVTIALAACASPSLVIADEPTNGLDEAAKQAFLRLLQTVFPDAGRLIITHDIGVAALCDRVLVLCGGRAMELGEASEVLNRPRHPYTRALLCALVENGMAETPMLREGSSVCPFYRRCPSAAEKCLAELPHRTDGKAEWWCGA